MTWKLSLVWKFTTSKTGKQIVTTHILPNILRSKKNQIMTFGRLVEYKMRNVFLKYPYKKCCRETSPRSFLSNQNGGYLGINTPEVYSLLLLYCMVFEEKYISRYILLTNQISLFDWFYLLRYWAICVLKIFFPSLWRHKLGN